LLPNLKHLPPKDATNTITGDSIHDYFVDGSPAIFRHNSKTYVAFGLRRGGKDLTTGGELTNQYTILNVTNYRSPLFSAYIPKTVLCANALDTTSERLGQSWATPHFMKMRTSSGSRDVLLIGGGYDTNQDLSDPGSRDTKGRAVFAYDLETGTKLDQLNFNYAKGNTDFRYCVVDFKAYDNDDDGCDDTVYVPTVGGDLISLNGRSNDGTWTERVLFSATPSSSSPTLFSNLRKFFYAPGIAQMSWNGQVGDWVYIGSGDREHPKNSSVLNRFYAIRNTWDSWNLTDANLTDMSDDILQDSSATSQDITNRLGALSSSKGWYFNLAAGEKVVSTPLVFNKVVYFTTPLEYQYCRRSLRRRQRCRRRLAVCRRFRDGKGSLPGI